MRARETPKTPKKGAAPSWLPSWMGVSFSLWEKGSMKDQGSPQTPRRGRLPLGYPAGMGVLSPSGRGWVRDGGDPHNPPKKEEGVGPLLDFPGWACEGRFSLREKVRMRARATPLTPREGARPSCLSRLLRPGSEEGRRPSSGVQKGCPLFAYYSTCFPRRGKQKEWKTNFGR